MIKKIHILGGGVSGLVCALEAARKGIDSVIYEKFDVAGGRLRSARYGNWYLDSGAQIFHTSDESMLAYWRDVFGDLFLTPTLVAKKFRNGEFLNLPEATTSNESSGFLAELIQQQLFLKNYTKKIFGTTADRLSSKFISEFVGVKEACESYGDRPWTGVPKYGGSQAADILVEKVIRSGASIRYGKALVNIESSSGKISCLHFADGSKIDVRPDELVISSLPLTRMSTLLGIKNTLHFKKVKVVGLLVDKVGFFPEGAAWIYFDSPEFLYHKVTLQNNISAYGLPDEKSVLSCEIAYDAGDKFDAMTSAELTHLVAQQFEKLGFFSASEIVSCKVLDLGPAFPCLRTEDEAAFANVISELAAYENFYLNGTLVEYPRCDLHTIFSNSLKLINSLIGSSSNNGHISGNGAKLLDTFFSDNKNSVSTEGLPESLKNFGLPRVNETASSNDARSPAEESSYNIGRNYFSFQEDIAYLHKWSEKVKAIAAKLRKKADEEGGIAAFTIGCTTKPTKGLRPYTTPVRSVSDGFVGGVVVYTQTQSLLACCMVDGIVDHIFVDAEKKLPLLVGLDKKPLEEFGLPVQQMEKSLSSLTSLEMGNLSSACSRVIKHSGFFEYKSNDMTVEGLWYYLSSRMNSLSGRKIAIIGGGNIGFKIAVKLVESGCNVQFVRRDVNRGLLLSNAVNVIKPPATQASATYNSDPVQACFFCDAVLGCTNGKAVITPEMIKGMKPGGVLIDVGKGSIVRKAVEFAVKSGIHVLRFDVSAAIDGMVSTIERNRSYSKCIGRVKLKNGVSLVSGGYLGADGDVAVDDCHNPTQIFGICDGAGDFKSVFSQTNEQQLESVRLEFYIGENGFK